MYNPSIHHSIHSIIMRILTLLDEEISHHQDDSMTGVHVVTTKRVLTIDGKTKSTDKMNDSFDD